MSPAPSQSILPDSTALSALDATIQRIGYAPISVDDSDEDTIILDMSGDGHGNAFEFSSNYHGTTGSAVQSFVPLVDLTISTTSSPSQLSTSPVYALIDIMDMKRSPTSFESLPTQGIMVIIKKRNGSNQYAKLRSLTKEPSSLRKECLFCLDERQDGLVYLKCTSCTQFMHLTCIEEWVSRRDTQTTYMCPTCQTYQADQQFDAFHCSSEKVTEEFTNMECRQRCLSTAERAPKASESGEQSIILRRLSQASRPHPEASLATRQQARLANTRPRRSRPRRSVRKSRYNGSYPS